MYVCVRGVCMCMYVCMYAAIYICTYVRMCVYVCMYVCMLLCICSMYVCMFVCMQLYICMYVRIQVRTYVAHSGCKNLGVGERPTLCTLVGNGGNLSNFVLFAAAYLRNPFFWVMALHQWIIAHWPSVVFQKKAFLPGRIFATFIQPVRQGSPCSVSPQQCCQVQLRMMLMSVRGMSSRHVDYAADAFEFGFDDKRRKTRETCSGRIKFYVQRIARVTRTSAWTMHKTVPLMNFQSRAAKRRRFPDVSENTAVTIVRVND